MRHQIAPVKNIRLLMEAGHALKERPVGVPGIGVVWGATGYGKTTAAAWLTNQVNAVYLRANATWTPSSMLGGIAKELGGLSKSNCSAMLDFITDRLLQNPRPVFVDEADYLTGSKRLVETLRDLHDISSVPLLLIGMGDFKRRVNQREQLAGRVAQWVEFRAADLADARTLADTVCEVAIADDLLVQLHAHAKGSMRGMAVGLSRIEAFALRHEKTKVSAKDWGDQAFTLQSISTEVVN